MRKMTPYLAIALGMLPNAYAAPVPPSRTDKPRDPDVSRELMARAEAKREMRKAKRRARG